MIPVIPVQVEAARPLVGVLALSEDRVVVGELSAFLSGADVEIVAMRVGMPEAFTLDGYRKMGEAFRSGAASLSRRCSMVAVACASAAVAIGPAQLTGLVHESLPGIAAVEPISAYVDSLADRSVKRIALVTPYAAGTHEALSELLEAQGIAVAASLRLQVPTGHVPSDVAADSILEAVKQARLKDAGALVISCTALPTADLLEGLEEHLGMPVVTTNRALAESIGVASNA